MKKLLSRFVPLSLLLALVLASISMPALSLGSSISVEPSQIVNNVDNVITVFGTDFPEGSSVVILEGYGALTTSYVNTTVLTAQVPAGIGKGRYTVTVSTGTESASCSECLQVVEPTPTQIPDTPQFTRPQLVVASSKASGDVAVNSQFKFNLGLQNVGTAQAYNLQVVFSSSDLAPLKNGGIVAVDTVPAGDKVGVGQTFLVTGQIWGQAIIMLDATVSYYDEQGTSYSDKFTLTIPTSNGGGSGVVYPTATPTGVKTSQLVITSYAESIDPLEPGEQFTLTMTVQNVGNQRAQRVTMIVGGGSSGQSGGTPQPGGVSGGSGEFTNFAPVGASNVQSLGELAAGEMIQAKQNLIVNVSTNPGAYPMKVTFSYLDDKNEVINDEQVITLLVYSLPKVDVSFYRPPDPFFVGQPGALPIQVVNIGKRSAVLGNLKLETDSGTIENATGLIGSIDAGGYFTIDSLLTPEKSGPMTLNVTIDYTDDFNQARTMTKTLQVDVMEGMIEEPIDPSVGGPAGGGGGGEEFPVVTEETALQKVWRFVLGIFGLDSAPPSGGEPVVPPVEEPLPQVKPGGKG